MAAPLEDTDLLENDDYYAWLGLSRDANTDDVNNAFRRLSRIYHPDKHATTPEKSKNAQRIFTKLKKAHEVLSDPHTKAIYDTMGVKGLQTDGWEVVPRTKTPQEIIEEYERLKQEREERRLQMLTSPVGSLAVSINATDIFDRYDVSDDDLELYGDLFPHIEISSMSISQSIEAPLTMKDTAVITGSLQSSGGVGAGSVTTSCRRIINHKSWAEVELSAGSQSGFTLRGFRRLWGRTVGIMSGSVQFTPKGFIPTLSTMVSTQLDQSTEGRIVWKAGGESSMQTSVVWTKNNHTVKATLQLAIPNTFAALRYSYNFVDAQARGALRIGIYGLIFEYGGDKKITKFARVGFTVLFGNAIGVMLRLKLTRGKQTYLCPISLSENVLPDAVFYATALPIIAFYVVNKLLIIPFMKDQKEKEILKKKKANEEKLAKDKKDAEATVELMKETVERSIEAEEKKAGLIIRKALYGKLLKENEEVSEAECINVTKQLQALVTNSEVRLAANTAISELPGFYDPCIGEDKELSIRYEFRRQMHYCRIPDNTPLLIPLRAHICSTSNTSTPGNNSDGLHQSDKDKLNLNEPSDKGEGPTSSTTS